MYFIECGEKKSVFSRVRSTSEKADIDMNIYLVFTDKR